jgi:S1-C subfamily serine protease
MIYNTPLISEIFYGPNIAIVQNTLQSQSAQEIARTAKAVSVNIETEPDFNGNRGLGSGVIIQQQGDLYTVLTAAHVVRRGTLLKLTTAIDNQVHQIVSGSLQRAKGDVDLAVAQFRSDKSYQVAKIGDSSLLESGMDVYVAGFPVPTLAITERVWVFREGKVTANSSKAFKDGYSLIYSNSTLPGMSGGGVLNRYGELVGIHGKGDRTADNFKTDYNLGMPISLFSEVAKEIKLPGSTEVPVTPASVVGAL